MRRSLVALVFVFCIALMASQARASTPITGCMAITTSGDYTLDSLTVPATDYSYPSCISIIGVSNVNIDLMGHRSYFRMTSAPSFFTGYVFWVENSNNVVIRNGNFTVANVVGSTCVGGIIITTSNAVTVENLQIDSDCSPVQISQSTNTVMDRIKGVTDDASVYGMTNFQSNYTTIENCVLTKAYSFPTYTANYSTIFNGGNGNMGLVVCNSSYEEIFFYGNTTPVAYTESSTCAVASCGVKDCSIYSGDNTLLGFFQSTLCGLYNFIACIGNPMTYIMLFGMLAVFIISIFGLLAYILTRRD